MGHRLSTHDSVAAVWGLSSYGSQALEQGSVAVAHGLVCSEACLPRSETGPMSPALAERFLSTVPPGKSLFVGVLKVPEFIEFSWFSS